MAEAAPSFSVLLNRLRGGPRNLLLIIPQFVLSLGLVVADTLSVHDRALLVSGLMEPLLAAFQDEDTRR